MQLNQKMLVNSVRITFFPKYALVFDSNIVSKFVYESPFRFATFAE